MPWVNNEYQYTTGILKSIARDYGTIYDGLQFGYWGSMIINPWQIAEYKADFDMALNEIGKGNWKGEIREFKAYKMFGRLQQVVIADIICFRDYDLVRLGFYRISNLKSIAYSRMVNFLNDGKQIHI